MASIALPELPKDQEFEDYVSAFFQAAGYYIERNVVEREGAPRYSRLIHEGKRVSGMTGGVEE